MNRRGSRPLRFLFSRESAGHLPPTPLPSSPSEVRRQPERSRGTLRFLQSVNLRVSRVPQLGIRGTTTASWSDGRPRPSKPNPCQSEAPAQPARRYLLSERPSSRATEASRTQSRGPIFPKGLLLALQAGMTARDKDSAPRRGSQPLEPSSGRTPRDSRRESVRPPPTTSP